MLLRLKMYQLLLKAAIYLLPFPAYEMGWLIWNFCVAIVGRPALYVHGGHYALVTFSCFVWAFMAERYKVTNMDELFRERTGARAAWSANLATSVVLLGTLYFARDAVFPRGLFVADMVSLLILTVLVHAFFRFLYRKRLRLERPTRILVVGADQFAHDAAMRLQRLSYSQCEVVGYVRLPGQDVVVADSHVYDLDQVSDSARPPILALEGSGRRSGDPERAWRLLRAGSAGRPGESRPHQPVDDPSRDGARPGRYLRAAQ